MAKIESRTIEIGARYATIRTADEADAARTLELLRVGASETDYLPREPDEIAITVEEEKEFLRQRGEAINDLFLHAEVDGRIVAIASLMGSDLRRLKHGATLGITVLREFWGQGLGRTMIETLLNWAESRSLVRVALEVVETNTRAIRLYQSLGFREEGRLRAHRIQGGRFLDTILMARVSAAGAG